MNQRINVIERQTLQVVDGGLTDPRHGAERHEQQDGKRAQDQNAVGEGQAVAAFGQLARKKSISRYEVREEGKAVERGISTRVQDEHGGELHQQEQHVAEGAGAELLAPMLDHRVCRSFTADAVDDDISAGKKPPSKEAGRKKRGKIAI